MELYADNNPQYIFDYHFAIKCPHCQAKSNLSAVSIPRFEYVKRFELKTVGIVYRCDSCNEPVFMKFEIKGSPSSNLIEISENYTEIERPKETFELHYLPEEISSDFGEALKCFSESCFNAFAAMCRRTIQSVSMNLGTDGSSKVQNQLKDLKAMGVIDEDTFTQLKEIMLAGHDGAHPHLPKLSPERASVLLELMKDVLYQLFIRQAKIKESMALRKKAITESSSS